MSEPGGIHDLEAAIAAASEHLGVSATVPPGAEVEAEVLGPRRVALPVLVALLVLSVGLSAFLALRPPPAPPPARVEAELRWSVAHVVRQIEDARARTGRLPAADRLVGLGEAIEYAPATEGTGYVVVGRAWSVEVEYDGTVPLDTWTALRLY